MTDEIKTGEQQAAGFRARLEAWLIPLSPADKLVVLEWVDRALDGDHDDEHDIAAMLVVGCIDGTFEIAGVRDGQVMLRISAAGLAEVESLMLASSEARHYLKSLTGGAAVDEPKDPQ